VALCQGVSLRACHKRGGNLSLRRGEGVALCRKESLQVRLRRDDKIAGGYVTVGVR